MEREPDFREQDSGVPVTPEHSPAPEEPSGSPPSPPADPSRSSGRAPGEGGSPAAEARDRTEGGSTEFGDPATAMQGDEGGPAVPSPSESGLDESNPAQGL